jgi:cyclopropane fatty-acyl-phospholipid synthase-like methyltransferase
MKQALTQRCFILRHDAGTPDQLAYLTTRKAVMENSIPRPDTINKLRFAADAAFAMLAGMQLEVFTPLKAGPMTAEQIAAAIGIGPSRLRLLLYVLVSAGLLTEQDGCFSNTPEANQFLVKGAPSYMGNRHAAIAMRWTTYFKTAESVRSGRPQAKVDFSTSPQEDLEAFLRNINANTVAATRALLEKYDFSSVKTVADVGSGGGGVAITITKTFPHIVATAIDLPEVAPIARKIVEEEGMTERVKVVAADVLSGPLTGSYDVAILRALLQVLSPRDARVAIKHIGAAVNPGGMIYIIGQILDDSRRSPIGAVGFNLTFINAFEAGESYTEREHRDWLTDAGFVDIERANFLLDDGSGLITARKRIQQDYLKRQV